MAVAIAGYAFFMVMFTIMGLARVANYIIMKRQSRKIAVDRVVNFL
jgi:hypothetical protein